MAAQVSSRSLLATNITGNVTNSANYAKHESNNLLTDELTLILLIVGSILVLICILCCAFTIWCIFCAKPISKEAPNARKSRSKLSQNSHQESSSNAQFTILPQSLDQNQGNIVDNNDESEDDTPNSDCNHNRHKSSDHKILHLASSNNNHENDYSDNDDNEDNVNSPIQSPKMIEFAMVSGHPRDRFESDGKRSEIAESELASEDRRKTPGYIDDEIENANANASDDNIIQNTKSISKRKQEKRKKNSKHLQSVPQSKEVIVSLKVPKTRPYGDSVNSNVSPSNSVMI